MINKVIQIWNEFMKKRPKNFTRVSNFIGNSFSIVFNILKN
jgi:hypothetical protein